MVNCSLNNKDLKADKLLAVGVLSVHLDFKVVAVWVHHGLNPGPEARADIGHKVCGHCSPLAVNGGLEAVDVAVEHCASPPLNIARDSVVQGGTIRGGGGPH